MTEVTQSIVNIVITRSQRFRSMPLS